MVQTIIIKTQILMAIAALVAVFSCNLNPKQKLLSFGPKVVEGHGYVVIKDSMAEPKVVPAGKPTVVRAGKPKVTFTNTNVHPAGILRGYAKNAIMVISKSGKLWFRQLNGRRED